MTVAQRKRGRAKVQHALVDATITIDGDKVFLEGACTVSWHRLANRLDAAQCLAVMLVVSTHPYPLGKGDQVYAVAKHAADRSVASNAGRQLPLFPPDTPESPLEVMAHGLLINAERRASQLGCSRLAALRHGLVVSSHDRMNDPVDSYMRIAVGRLDGY